MRLAFTVCALVCWTSGYDTLATIDALLAIAWALPTPHSWVADRLGWDEAVARAEDDARDRDR